MYVPLSSPTLPLPRPVASNKKKTARKAPPTTIFTTYFPAAGAGAAGDNKAKTCDELFKVYKACRKAEQDEVIRQRIANRKSIF